MSGMEVEGKRESETENGENAQKTLTRDREAFKL